MKKILIALAATTALAAAVPAAAQPWRGDNDYRDDRRYEHRGHVDHRLTTSYVDSLEWKIRNAAQERRISWQDARELREQLRQVQPLAWRVETGRASSWEHQRLERTVNRIERAVNSYARYDRRYDRDYGYGYGRDWRR
jgi:hypothetical protein